MGKRRGTSSKNECCFTTLFTYFLCRFFCIRLCGNSHLVFYTFRTAYETTRFAVTIIMLCKLFFSKGRRKRFKRVFVRHSTGTFIHRIVRRFFRRNLSKIWFLFHFFFSTVVDLFDLCFNAVFKRLQPPSPPLAAQCSYLRWVLTND